MNIIYMYKNYWQQVDYRLNYFFISKMSFLCLTLHFLLAALSQFHLSFATSNPRGLSIRAVLDDSPQSPLYNIANLTSSERIERLINITNSRVNYLHSVLHPKANLAPENIGLAIARDGLFYAVSFTMGSQQHLVKLLLDTGGGLIWTQCQPCRNCFPQRLPIYDPRASSTYGTLPCSHPLCQGNNRLYNCVNGVCVYNVHYCGGALTSGVTSLEKFQFLDRDAGIKSFNNVIFGCSNDNRDIAFENGDISGIFGLNLSPDSFLSQLAPFIHGRFSYCFVPFIEAMPHPIVLRFGEDIPRRPNVQTTAFVPVPQQPYYYYLELLDVTVANHRLGFNPDTFRVKPDGTGGLYIDSGALYSVIDTNTVGINAFEAVMGVFQAYYGSRKLQRVHGPPGFELCYQTPPRYYDFADIIFHFNGADYYVPGPYGHFFGQGVFCVAILRGTFGMSMLGAVHQQNKRIIHDMGIYALQFADEKCINDH